MYHFASLCTVHHFATHLVGFVVDVEVSRDADELLRQNALHGACVVHYIVHSMVHTMVHCMVHYRHIDMVR